MIVLRERQKLLIDRLMVDTQNHQSVLLIAPTGSGKTVMLSAFMGNLICQNPTTRILCLVHRREISDQNLKTALKFNLKCQIYLDKSKTIDPEINVIFSMQITAFKALENDPHVFGKIDYIIVDEAHHINSYSYRVILHNLYQINKDLRAVGWTATPLRGDRELISDIFQHLSDQIFLSELIAEGLLVPPIILTHDKPRECKRGLTSRASLLKWWKQEAHIEDSHYRPTVAFLPSLKHCRVFNNHFKKQGFKSAYIHGEMNITKRKRILDNYAQGKIQILFNFGILIEGWNEPYTSCVIIARKNSHSSVILQMIGRGLRILNGDEIEHTNPYVKDKKDCLVLDYWGATIGLPGLEQFLPLKDKFIGINPFDNKSDNKDYKSIKKNKLEELIDNLNKNSPIYYDTIKLSGTILNATYSSIDKSTSLIISRPVEGSKRPESILFVSTKDGGLRIAYIGSFVVSKKISDDFIKSTTQSSFYKTQKTWGGKESLSMSVLKLRSYIVRLPALDFKWAWIASVQRIKPTTCNTMCFYVSLFKNNFKITIPEIDSIFNS
jgi:superfamily II DNA or RNA helicase